MDRVSSPDLIRRVYHFQYNVLKAIHAEVGFGSGTETSMDLDLASFYGLPHRCKCTMY